MMMMMMMMMHDDDDDDDDDNDDDDDDCHVTYICKDVILGLTSHVAIEFTKLQVSLWDHEKFNSRLEALHSIVDPLHVGGHIRHKHVVLAAYTDVERQKSSNHPVSSIAVAQDGTAFVTLNVSKIDRWF
ncbi:hypothetical protein ElyMa_000810000 [Elysia marginata]|uniref:Uncharacterized protein n=1 Tax=Elysia marginata TaxID=1093978 RepID=A0AAV4GYB3_9GAST|nr:hypothetical protein ElyMa_000810000 [Elysia marginata]